MATSRAAIAADYQQKWDTLQVTRKGAVEAASKIIISHWDEYKAVEAKTGVPAAFIGVLHMRECDNNMRGCLHNGELIIGTNRKTRIAPVGRGPFKTFFDSAIDALDELGFTGMSDFSPGALCEAGERYNGLGYRMRGKSSPYLWAGSQWYSSGKFIGERPGVKAKYSPGFVDPQLGIAPVMKRVMELAPGKSFVGKVVAKAQEKRDVAKQTAPSLHFWDGFLDYVGLGGLTLGGLLQQLGAFVVDTRTLAILAAGGSVWIGVKLLKYRAGFKPITAADGDNSNA